MKGALYQFDTGHFVYTAFTRTSLP
jgi:hypothetical protein